MFTYVQTQCCMHLEKHNHCFMHILASKVWKRCLGHFWAPPSLKRVAGRGAPRGAHLADVHRQRAGADRRRRGRDAGDCAHSRRATLGAVRCDGTHSRHAKHATQDTFCLRLHCLTHFSLAFMDSIALLSIAVEDRDHVPADRPSELDSRSSTGGHR